MTKENEVEKLSKEEKKDLVSRAKAREIVRSIMDYGVSQDQIVYIISMLSLELENLDLARDIRNVLSQEEKFQKAATVQPEEKKKTTKIFV